MDEAELKILQNMADQDGWIRRPAAEIADALGVSKRTISRLMKDLRETGKVMRSRNGRWFRIHEKNQENQSVVNIDANDANDANRKKDYINHGVTNIDANDANENVVLSFPLSKDRRKVINRAHEAHEAPTADAVDYFLTAFPPRGLFVPPVISSVINRAVTEYGESVVKQAIDDLCMKHGPRFRPSAGHIYGYCQTIYERNRRKTAKAANIPQQEPVPESAPESARGQDIFASGLIGLKDG